LKLGNEQIEFKARFGGAAREIVVPIDHVVAIYARENGQGMAFPVPSTAGGASAAGPTLLPAGEPAVRGPRLMSVDTTPAPTAVVVVTPAPAPEPPAPGPGGARPSLKRIK
jgi:stringent starvation protein B